MAVLVIPLNVKVPAVEFARAHVPPRVITMVWLEPNAVELVHVPVNPPVNVTVDDDGTLVPAENVTVMVEPALKAPLAEGVNPMVHGVTVDAVVLVGAKVTAETAVAAVMVTAAAGFTAVVSFEVTTLKPVVASVCAVGFVSPVTVNVPALDAASAQVPFKVTVMVWPEVTADALVQVPVKAPASVTFVRIGITTPDGNVAVIVEEEVKAPEDDVVKPTVHDVVEPAFARAGENVTALTELPEEIVTAADGLTAAPSTDVATLKPAAASVCAVGFVIPESERTPDVEFAKAHVLPNETVTVCPDTVADAVVQFPVKPVPIVTVSTAGKTTPLGKTIVTLEDPVSAPDDDDVNPIVQGVVTLAALRVGVNVTAVTAVAAVMVTAALGLIAAAFADVATLKPVAASVCADGFVSPVITMLADAKLAKAQVDVSVTTTVCVPSVVVAPVQTPVNDPLNVTVDCVGMMTPVGNVAVIVEPELSAPEAPAVKPTVHDVVVPAVARAGAKLTL